MATLFMAQYMMEMKKASLLRSGNEKGSSVLRKRLIELCGGWGGHKMAILLFTSAHIYIMQPYCKTSQFKVLKVCAICKVDTAIHKN